MWWNLGLCILLVLDIAADAWLFREQRRQHREYLAEMRRQWGRGIIRHLTRQPPAEEKKP